MLKNDNRPDASSEGYEEGSFANIDLSPAAMLRRYLGFGKSAARLFARLNLHGSSKPMGNARKDFSDWPFILK